MRELYTMCSSIFPILGFWGIKFLCCWRISTSECCIDECDGSWSLISSRVRSQVQTFVRCSRPHNENSCGGCEGRWELRVYSPIEGIQGITDCTCQYEWVSILLLSKTKPKRYTDLEKEIIINTEITDSSPSFPSSFSIIFSMLSLLSLIFNR